MIFVDTWAWVGLADKSDPYHRKAKAEHKRLQRAKSRYVTTDFVFSEAVTYLYDALTAVEAQRFLASLLSAADAGTYLLIHVSPQQFSRAWQMRQKYHDKPDISFVDFTSMVIMQDMGITQVFSGDTHFLQVNLGFQLLP